MAGAASSLSFGPRYVLLRAPVQGDHASERATMHSAGHGFVARWTIGEGLPTCVVTVLITGPFKRGDSARPLHQPLGSLTTTVAGRIAGPHSRRTLNLMTCPAPLHRSPSSPPRGSSGRRARHSSIFSACSRASSKAAATGPVEIKNFTARSSFFHPRRDAGHGVVLVDFHAGRHP